MYITNGTASETRARKMSLSQYKKRKIKMLENDFYVILTAEEKEHINQLTSETEIDRYVRACMGRRWH